MNSTDCCAMISSLKHTQTIPANSTTYKIHRQASSITETPSLRDRQPTRYFHYPSLKDHHANCYHCYGGLRVTGHECTHMRERARIWARWIITEVFTRAEGAQCLVERGMEENRGLSTLDGCKDCRHPRYYMSTPWSSDHPMKRNLS